ncbi:MAG: AgmX/PglI C-terminal domain-containing protein [Polyangiaceae bacterium]
MSTASRFVFVVTAVFAAGCGGGGVRRASAPAESAPVPVSSVPSISSTGDSTTTAPLSYDGGAGQGTKLALIAEGLDAGSDASSDGGGRRAHEPGRGPDDIRARVVARRAETRACFEKVASAPPGGRSLTMQWTIDPKGNVDAPSLDASRSDVTDPTVVHCIADILKSIKFAASPGGYETKASYPFIVHRQRNSDAGSP